MIDYSGNGLSPIPSAPAWPPWPAELSRQSWPTLRQEIQERLLQMLGLFPELPRVANLCVIERHRSNGFRQLKVAYDVEAGDTAKAWLLIPNSATKDCPAVLAHHASTRGTGKDRVIGLQGYRPGTAPDADSAYALDLVRAGFVVLAPDVWGDGERLPVSGLCRDTRELYEKHPQWSYLGKIIWDCMRGVDVLAALPEVDPERIGMTGHSLGAIATVFTAAFEPRLKVLVSNGCVASWYEQHQPGHWALDDSDGQINCFIRRLRPYLTPERWREIPVQWPQIMALAAPRPLLVIQAGKGPEDNLEEHWAHYGSNHVGCREIYNLLDAGDNVCFVRTEAGHGFPHAARQSMVQWFQEYL